MPNLYEKEYYIMHENIRMNRYLEKDDLAEWSHDIFHTPLEATIYQISIAIKEDGWTLWRRVG